MVDISAAAALPPIVGNGQTVVISTPLLDLSQTWNAAGVTFTAAKVNITNTASAAGSLLLDLQVGGVSQFKVGKDGTTTTLGSVNASNGNVNANNFQWNSGSTIVFSDAANRLDQRNGLSPQIYFLYNTYTDGSNYERGAFRWNGGVLQLSSEQGGTGLPRSVEIGTNGAAGLYFMTVGVDRWTVNTSGHLLALTDNTYDIGANGANRPRNIYVSSAINLQGSGGFNLSGNANVNLNAGSYVKRASQTVASLLAAGAGTAGVVAYVTDSSVAAAGNFGAVVAGGGANSVPVYCDGTNWRIG